MKLIKPILYIENETPNLLLDTFEALQIIDAVSETFSICGKGANSLLKIKEIDLRVKEKIIEVNNDNLNGLRMFDEFSLDEDLLIVTIGNESDLKEYVAKRINRSTDHYRWNIINSTYARIGYLDRRKNLSSFIPFDTLRWLIKQIDTFGVTMFNDCLKTLVNSSVLILGESIIDEYIFCDALGRVTKDPLIAFEKRTTQKQLGGVLAVARHFSGLGITSNVITKWSMEDQNFINNETTSKKMKVFNLESNKSIKKTRYVDRASNMRVFETYELPSKTDYLTSPQVIKKLVSDEQIKFDHLVLMDYGHSFFNHEVAQEYLNFGTPVSVNTQSNAGNRGFNPISNYSTADIVFLNGHEVQFEMRNNVSKLETIITNLGIRLNCKELYVTSGSSGIISWSKEKGIITSPTFAPTVIDRTGAGDALLAAISSLRMNNVPIEIATFFGNIAGSLLVGMMGNERSITSTDLQFEAERIMRKVKNL